MEFEAAFTSDGGTFELVEEGEGLLGDVAPAFSLHISTTQQWRHRAANNLDRPSRSPVGRSGRLAS
ncbi:hypothetical protein [Streptomyces sp. NPDC059639]|uniref:hypothetical protein n=1 Tax=Streptomyces sp. NPDC059639 TaxID=3346891 RepID=UPI00367A51C1